MRQTAEKNWFEPALATLIGIGFAQSAVVGGMNFSIADIGILLFLWLKILQKRISISIVGISFLALIILWRSLTTLTIIPVVLPGVSYLVLPSIIKFGIVIMYLIAGWNLAQNDRNLRAFLVGIVAMDIAMAIVGIFLNVFNLTTLAPSLFMEFRYQGLMNDPNYYSLVQLLGIPIVKYLWSEKRILNWGDQIILTCGALISGSKSAAVAIVIIMLIQALLAGVKWVTTGDHLRLIVVVNILIVGILLGWLFRQQIMENIAWLGSQNEAINRITSLTDSDALSGDGSGRTSAWGHALTILNATATFGIGWHDYAEIAQILTGSNVIAHNTFLQIAVEWGILLAISFIFLLLYTTIKQFLLKKQINQTLAIMMVMTIIYSFSVSLNNSRVFWVIFAIILGTQFKLVQAKSLKHGILNSEVEG